ncbi:NTP transferase domain-containing protein [Loigolactobacillus rennini]|uniref:MobA-like NTP transferase domain-containing protein n=1 Tax=Loigolactobacillus rennini DSM 20253 TaxID=1423796 RepID=A0A0R2DA96_9LACO|nr:NTP transferase domain-containing protein [Loigolactobacillus rennini]KRM97641.1 hypothetical protein FC24_GL001405 [Loigolactobacillus rennini DSM 20253]
MFAKTSVVIMASGYSRRMGHNKLFLQYHGRTFLMHTLDLVHQAAFNQIILVIKPEDYQNCDLPSSVEVILNSTSYLGQSVSVRLGTQSVTSDSCLYLPIDQPKLSVKLLKQMQQLAAPDRIVFPSFQGQARAPVCFGSQFFSELMQVTGKQGGRLVKQRHPEAWRPIEVVDYNQLQDIDNWAAYCQFALK